LEALCLEGFRVLVGVGDGLADGGADVDAAGGFVELDPQAEGVEGLALDLGWGVAEGLAEVGDLLEALVEVLVLGLDVGGVEFGEGVLGGVFVVA
jgi:hypothetical protein